LATSDPTSEHLLYCKPPLGHRRLPEGNGFDGTRRNHENQGNKQFCGKRVI
jgi:hypothetical protein